MSELWPVIRHKFSSALAAWHPSDASAHVILAPWRRVFGPRDWEALLARSVLPKLAAGLAGMAINPAAQEIEPLEWALAWRDALPPAQLAGLLEAHLFPRWHAVLRHWLANSPDYDEVTRWCVLRCAARAGRAVHAGEQPGRRWGAAGWLCGLWRGRSMGLGGRVEGKAGGILKQSSMQ